MMWPILRALPVLHAYDLFTLYTQKLMIVHRVHNITMRRPHLIFCNFTEQDGFDVIQNEIMDIP